MTALQQIKGSLLHLIFPHTCAGCGTELHSNDTEVCAACLAGLPQTYFIEHGNNGVEKIFWGRLPLRAAAAGYYVTGESVMQHLLYACKYGGNKDLGRQLGRLLGHSLNNTHRFNAVDAVVPLPLHPKKERARGFNQALLLCQGIADVTGRPVLANAVVRTAYTQSQTRKNRTQRWQNMEQRFAVADVAALQGKHLLLVDDVVTTGATLEACGRALLQAPGVTLSLLTLCYAGGN